MVLQLNNFFTLFVFLIACVFSNAQEGVGERNNRDYKDPDQFDKFHKRRVTVGAWQIHQLKEGALVVRLKTNQILIDALLKQGKDDLAREIQLQQFAINKNTMFAYRDNLSFCKVYFIYSTSSDSLLDSSRSGIFLDTTLTVDYSIVMKESFYLLAERDFAYNSSIGFVPEDSAKTTRERGNPVKEMAVVIKNKYGHQLKTPFPYYVKEKNFMNAKYNFPIQTTPNGNNGFSISFAINRTYLEDLKTKPEPKEITIKGRDKSVITTVKLKKEFTYEKLSLAITELNDNLFQMYNTYPKPDVSRVKAAVKLFFY
ncbi:hypothetical protein [Aurantibacillus circumpalustris]|uniref:hypothetical protein n=1 Tax=Aurantibacillus circumpalustris TaxID=3036359 RepID=UPI00295B3BFF|nr:hypothetical protein [Aurantibacillus circumpalustris]